MHGRTVYGCKKESEIILSRQQQQQQQKSSVHSRKKNEVRTSLLFFWGRVCALAAFRDHFPIHHYRTAIHCTTPPTPCKPHYNTPRHTPPHSTNPPHHNITLQNPNTSPPHHNTNTTPHRSAPQHIAAYHRTTLPHLISPHHPAPLRHKPH